MELSNYISKQHGRYLNEPVADGDDGHGASGWQSVCYRKLLIESRN